MSEAASGPAPTGPVPAAPSVPGTGAPSVPGTASGSGSLADAVAPPSEPLTVEELVQRTQDYSSKLEGFNKKANELTGLGQALERRHSVKWRTPNPFRTEHGFTSRGLSDLWGNVASAVRTTKKGKRRVGVGFFLGLNAVGGTIVGGIFQLPAAALYGAARVFGAIRKKLWEAGFLGKVAAVVTGVVTVPAEFLLRGLSFVFRIVSESIFHGFNKLGRSILKSFETSKAYNEMEKIHGRQLAMQKKSLNSC